MKHQVPHTPTTAASFTKHMICATLSLAVAMGGVVPAAFLPRSRDTVPHARVARVASGIRLNPVGDASVVANQSPGSPTLPFTINDSPGDQNDPHVSGDWVAYTSDFAIRYYHFATHTDAQIPLGDSARDLLSDISGSKIVFSRVIRGVKTAVMVFDAATPDVLVEIDAAPGTTRLGSAIGGNTVAFIDFGLEANGELVIHDLTTATSWRITTDTAPDQSPAVSPDGHVVTWEHCNSSLSNCDIWKAVKSGAAWTVGVVSDTANAEANPDTNGTVVVYDSFRGGNSDLFWRSVAGSAEFQLQTPGFERNPSVAGGFMSFERRLTLGSTADIFVYDMVSNLLYQITDTPLVATVQSFHLRPAVGLTLEGELWIARALSMSSRAGDLPRACRWLNLFIYEVQAQTDRTITTLQAAQLTAHATQIRAVMGCG